MLEIKELGELPPAQMELRKESFRGIRKFNLERREALFVHLPKQDLATEPRAGGAFSVI